MVYLVINLDFLSNTSFVIVVDHFIHADTTVLDHQ